MPEHSLRRRQIVVVILLFTGYASLYFCRADLSVSTPLIVDELGAQGVNHDDALRLIGRIASWGVLGYAIGKLLLGGLGDFWGGRTNFIIGLAGAFVFTVLFAVTGLIPLFTLAWIGNRLIQSLSWAGLVKLSTKWFDYSFYGTILGILSLSYLVGDAVARQLMGMLIHQGFGWRVLFYFAAGVAALCLIASLLYLRESRTEMGFPEARTNPLNLFAQSESRPASIAALLRPLFLSPAFLTVCLLSFGCTIVRESFNMWTPMYLHEYVGYNSGDAASLSSIFPGVGAISVLAMGWLSDRMGFNGRALLMFIGLTATTGALLLMMSMPAKTAGSLLPLLGIGAVAFCLLGPYSYLGGAFAMDFGGKQGSALASGMIDGIGYLGGVLALQRAPDIEIAFGWQGVFVALAIASGLSAALAGGYLYMLGSRAAAVQQTAS
jgi:sugar phosphate permease